MTNTPTIDGVSRHLLERIVKDQCVSVAIVEQLRALLDADIQASVAPAVERQEPLKWLVKCCHGPVSKSVEKADESFWRSLKEARQYYGTDGEIDAVKASKLISVSPGEWFVVPLYRDPPEVSALQSTIAQFEGKLNKAIDLDFQRRETIEQLQARIAELESGRCEVITWRYCDPSGESPWFNGRPDEVNIQFVSRRNGVIEYGYSAPLAPVAVVLPDDWQDQLFAEMERRFGLHRSDDDRMVNDDTQVGVEFAIDWVKTCLDATAALSKDN